jgi:hypothetical protein
VPLRRAVDAALVKEGTGLLKEGTG